MKKNIIAAAIVSLCAVTGLFAQEQGNPDLKFRKLKLLNQDFAIPSENGVLGWKAQNPAWPCEMTVKEDPDGSKYMRVTPLDKQGKASPKGRTYISSSTKFAASVGDRVKISFKFRTNDISKGIAPLLTDSKFNQWAPSTRSVRNAEPGKWNEYAMIYTIKESRLKKKTDSYTLGFDIPVACDFKDVKLLIEKK